MKLRTEGGRTITVRPFRAAYLLALMAVLYVMAGAPAAGVGFLMALDLTVERRR